MCIVIGRRGHRRWDRAHIVRADVFGVFHPVQPCAHACTFFSRVLKRAHRHTATDTHTRRPESCWSLIRSAIIRYGSFALVGTSPKYVGCVCMCCVDLCVYLCLLFGNWLVIDNRVSLCLRCVGGWRMRRTAAASCCGLRIESRDHRRDVTGSTDVMLCIGGGRHTHCRLVCSQALSFRRPLSTGWTGLNHARSTHSVFYSRKWAKRFV